MKLDYVRGGPIYNRTYEVGGFTGVFQFNGSVGCAAASSRRGINLAIGGTGGESTSFTWLAYVWSQGGPGVIGSVGRCPGGPPVPAGDCVGASGYSVFWDTGCEDYSYSKGIMNAYPTTLYTDEWSDPEIATW